ncbi:hypothetical protein GCM10027084_24700 [Pseudoxanthomonas sangjuensis]|uniref:hypothetical protein n=1 Tax=Pseudoxanthomonas sangjuensis TaxID=1503750 RepID=UPI0013913E0C|nr:hypothetical protein [Pseudoxanthomonas sangjuensis]
MFDSSFTTSEEAKLAGMMRAGWIPDWIPSEARNLREVHNVDTNESALVFRVPTSTKWQPPESCRATEEGKIYKPVFKRGWIPDEWLGFDFYDCWKHPGSPALAVERTGQRVLFWRTIPW